MQAAAPQALEPFIAQYQVFKGGSVLGDATMQLVRNDPQRWRVDLGLHGTKGLIGLAGINAEQSTVFDVAGAGYRPLAQSTLRKSVFTRKQTVGVYDWRTHQARWTGDVKEARRAPVALQDGDQSGLLINLAVIRDAQPGKALQYRYVDDGRVRDHRYNVSTELDDVKVGDLSYSAMRVTRVESGQRGNHDLGGCRRAHADPHVAAGKRRGHLRPASGRVQRSAVSMTMPTTVLSLRGLLAAAADPRQRGGIRR